MTNTDHEKYRILVIDDNAAIHEDFTKILKKSGRRNARLQNMESLLFGAEVSTVTSPLFEIDCALQGEEGLEMVKCAEEEGRPFAVAFVDGRMPPGWDGIETISRLWRVAPNLQMVLCTAYADYSWQEIRDILGDSDSLLILKKPFDNIEVLQLAHALTRKWELNREIKGRLNQLAFFDHLTGLPNRTMFVNRLINALENARQYNHKGALLFIDLDDFKRINDTLGHSVGDELLKAIAGRLVTSLRLSDTVSRPTSADTAARLGGDEFTVILPKIEHQREAALVARRIEEHLEEPISLGNQEFIISSSIGIAIFPNSGDNVETLLRNADLAMYFSKSQGQGAYQYFEESMKHAAVKRLTIENELRHAIDMGELCLHYQPQVALDTGEIVGMEALLRWESKRLGAVSPLEFIPVAEESGLIVVIGEWVLRTACRQVQSWNEKGLQMRRIAVNVSVKQFTHPGFLKMMRDILIETRLPPEYLVIEITESLLGEDQVHIATILERLRATKVQVAVDDFGTGYSSLSRLKDIPIDCLKIDRSFICGIDQGSSDQSIIGAIMAMGEGMHLSIIAEGVDRDSQIAFLLQRKCREAQGFYFSPGVPADEAEELLKKGGFDLN